MKLLDFYSQSCGPCKTMAPIIHKLAEEFDVECIDVEVSQQMAMQYHVRSLPTFVVLDDSGNIINTIVGMTDESSLRKAMTT